VDISKYDVPHCEGAAVIYFHPFWVQTIGLNYFIGFWIDRKILNSVKLFATCEGIMIWPTAANL
jgi:hypothetical protein